jgi:hypothetical protein
MMQKQDEEQWLPVEKDIPLEQGDRVKTGDDGHVEILMDDGSMLELEENSEITIKELEVDHKSKDIKSTVFLWFGRVLSNIKKLTGRNSKFQISTATLVAGVRGTEFIVDATDPGMSEVGVFDGKVAVGSLDRKGNLLRDSEVFLTKGFQTSVQRGKRPRSPYGFTRRMLAHQKKMNRLRLKAREKRRELPQIMKRRIKAREQIRKKWEKIRREKSGKKDNTPQREKQDGQEKKDAQKYPHQKYDQKEKKNDHRVNQGKKGRNTKNTKKKKK